MTTTAKRVSILMIGVLSGVVSIAPGAQAGTDPPRCQVRNVARDTSGRCRQ